MSGPSQRLKSWSDGPTRFRSEAAFASFVGVSPIPASSGLTNRHRINRSGDRQLNRALHTITLIRMRLDPPRRPTSPVEWPNARPLATHNLFQTRYLSTALQDLRTLRPGTTRGP
ncbi:IS110 family transposase [Streptomyces flaveolus]|uniref:IS110 family transposase n=1 Tax=Streptomyces flaveolus TaxID=67297 RepID=UPI003D9FAB2B